MNGIKRYKQNISIYWFLKINKSNINQLLNYNAGSRMVSVDAYTMSILMKRISIHYNYFNSHKHNIPNGLNETINIILKST